MSLPSPVPSTATPSAPTGSPVAAAYRRAAEVMPTLRITEEPPRCGGGWVRGSELAAGGAVLAAVLAWEERSIVADHGSRPRPDVVASFALHRYAWPVGVLFTLPYFLQRRVPHLAPEDVSYHREDGRLTVDVGTFSCLPDDPAAEDPAARVVRDDAALREAVREAAAAHLGPVMAAFGPRMRRGRRALWGSACDELTEGLWYLGNLLGEEERAREEAAALLPGGTAPYAGSAAFRTLAGRDGQPLVTRDRASCCLYYTLRPEDTCVTCPRTCDAERVARLTATAS
ncbi:(2Fe-2S)-binding protein [Streptomyces sp. 4N509B]|uniref:(2Fe-2S)-binding protein n=1 Tax=Streptomyces sp. 4N509B TaxID=3457413 RepID=UPI003FD0B3C3